MNLSLDNNPWIAMGDGALHTTLATEWSAYDGFVLHTGQYVVVIRTAPYDRCGETRAVLRIVEIGSAP